MSVTLNVNHGADPTYALKKYGVFFLICTGGGAEWVALAHMGQGSYGPGPIWAKAHMGQGPYGPRAPGPRALPCWANTSPKNSPWKKESKLCFCFVVFWKQKRCATSVRSFWRRYRAEISAVCQKTKVSVFFLFCCLCVFF